MLALFHFIVPVNHASQLAKTARAKELAHLKGLTPLLMLISHKYLCLASQSVCCQKGLTLSVPGSLNVDVYKPKTSSCPWLSFFFVRFAVLTFKI